MFPIRSRHQFLVAGGGLKTLNRYVDALTVTVKCPPLCLELKVAEVTLFYEAGQHVLVRSLLSRQIGVLWSNLKITKRCSCAGGASLIHDNVSVNDGTSAWR